MSKIKPYKPDPKKQVYDKSEIERIIIQAVEESEQYFESYGEDDAAFYGISNLEDKLRGLFSLKKE